MCLITQFAYPAGGESSSDKKSNYYNDAKKLVKKYYKDYKSPIKLEQINLENPDLKTSANVESVIVETLLTATESWNGDSYDYPNGRPQITLQRIIAQPGFKTPLHFHSQPGIAYLVKGNLSCGTLDGKQLKVGPGDSFAAPQKSIHY